MPSIDPSIVDDVDLPTIRPRIEAGRRTERTGTAPPTRPTANGKSTPTVTPPKPRTASAKSSPPRWRSRTSLSAIGGRDVFDKAFQFRAADNARKMGVYPFFRPLDLNDGPEAVLEGRRVVMFGSNNYLGLTTHPKVREAANAGDRRSSARA